MKSRRILFTMLAFVVCCTALAEAIDFDAIPVNSSLNKWASSKYFAKGIDAINDYEYETAITMFEKEVKQHPSNGYAICNLAQCRFIIGMFDMTIDSVISSEGDIDEDIETVRKNGKDNMLAAFPLLDKGLSKLPATDREAQCQAYRAKAHMLLNMENVDTAQITACYDKAIAIHPCISVYEDHMDSFSMDPEVVAADAQMLRKINPEEPTYVNLLAAASFMNKDYTACLKYCDESIAMQKNEEDEDFDLKMGFIQILSLKELGREDEAMDLALNYIEEEGAAELFDTYLLLAKDDPDLAEIKVKQRLFAGSSDEMVLNALLGHIMEIKKDYTGALEYYRIVEKTNKDAYFFNKIANCYYMLGDTDNALKYIDVATIMDGDGDYCEARDRIFVNSGKASQLIAEKMMGVELIKIITTNDEFSERLNLAELLLQEHEYSQAANIIEPLLEISEDVKALSLYATALKGMGRDDDAQCHLQQIIEIDPMQLNSNPDVITALYATGHTEEALKQANSMALHWENYQIDSRDEETPESCYTIATVFAQIGNSDRTLEYLEKHFQHDDFPYNFGFMERDWRLDNVRELPQYKALVEKYKSQWKSNTISNNK